MRELLTGAVYFVVIVLLAHFFAWLFQSGLDRSVVSFFGALLAMTLILPSFKELWNA